MTRPDIDAVPSFYKPYVELVKDMDVVEALRQSHTKIQKLLADVPEEKGTHRYAEGKWTIKEVLNHLMDTERVFAYRALRFSRNDQTPLHPFNEGDYGPNANAHARTIAQLAAEMERLRATTTDLYTSFTDDMLRLEGTASGKVVSVLNLGYFIAGHEAHHHNILVERYLTS